MPQPPDGLPGPGELPATVPSDYDTDPGRFAANLAIRQRFGGGDVFAAVAQRLTGDPAAASPVLELGGGTGPLARQLSGTPVRVVVADLAAHLRAAPRPAVRTDASAPGFRSCSFGTVAALWMLYHLPDPATALAEAERMLRPGGWFVACAPSRFNDPELAPILPRWGQPLTFDAENAVNQVRRIFQIAAVSTWDEPLIHLPTSSDVRLYLRGRGLTVQQASRAAQRIRVPLRITKRGLLLWATKAAARGRDRHQAEPRRRGSR